MSPCAREWLAEGQGRREGRREERREPPCQWGVSVLVTDWGEGGEGGGESLTPDSDIDSGVFSQLGGPRQDTSESEEEEEEEGEGEEEEESPPAVPFTRKRWNRQNGWYRVRGPCGPAGRRDPHGPPGRGACVGPAPPRDLRAELALMRAEIAQMLTDTRELEEGGGESEGGSEESEEESGSEEGQLYDSCGSSEGEGREGREGSAPASY